MAKVIIPSKSGESVSFKIKSDSTTDLDAGGYDTSGVWTFEGGLKTDEIVVKTASGSQSFQNSSGTEVGSYDDSGAWEFGPEVQAGVDGVRHVFNTGDQGTTAQISASFAGQIQIGNGSSTGQAPSIAGVTTDERNGLALFSATPDTNSFADMAFDVRENDGTDFSTLTSKAFAFQRAGNTLGSCTRAGAWTFGSNTLVAEHTFYNDVGTAADPLSI